MHTDIYCPLRRKKQNIIKKPIAIETCKQYNPSYSLHIINLSASHLSEAFINILLLDC